MNQTEANSISDDLLVDTYYQEPKPPVSQGSVNQVKGEVSIVTSLGEVILASQGVEIHLNDRLFIGENASLVLKVNALGFLSLGQHQELAFTENLLEQLTQIEVNEYSGYSLSIANLEQALAEGKSLEELLPATAAGDEPVNQEGSASVLYYQRVGDSLIPNSVNIETTQVTEGFIASPLAVEQDPFIPNIEESELEPANSNPITSDEITILTEDSSITGDVLANDSDVDGDTLSVSSASAENGSVVINPDGTLTYTPNPNFNGDDLLTYIVSDGRGGSSSATVTITVLPVNDKPIAVDDAPMTTDEDTAATTANVLANDSDIDGDPLTIWGAIAEHGTVVINADGTLTYTPNENYHGDDLIRYGISDGQGEGDIAALSVTVNSVNDNPITDNETVIINEDSSISGDVLGNDVDVDGDTLFVSSASAANGTVLINADGTLTYTPNPNFNGTDTLSYTVSDGQGGSSNASVELTVLSVNDVPNAVDDAAISTDEDTAVTTGNVLANDSDIDGDPLTIWGAIANHGSVTINGDGTLTYTPNANFNGVDAITYGISDGQGGGDIASLAVTVNSVNDDPIVNNENAIIEKNTSISGDVLGNDLDLDGDALTVSSAIAQQGTASINLDGSLTYMPTVDFVGTDTLIYIVSDGQGGSSEGQVTIDVAEIVGTLNEDVLNGDEADNFIAGKEGNDNIIGNEGDDILFGGPDSDTLTGNGGSDTFLWRASDTESDAMDIVTDFTVGVGGDVLDFTDLLDGEEGGSLQEYLTLNFDGGNTTVMIDHDANPTTNNSRTSVILEGVDLSGGGLNSPEAIFQQLIADGNLVVDQS